MRADTSPCVAEPRSACIAFLPHLMFLLSAWSMFTKYVFPVPFSLADLVPWRMYIVRDPRPLAHIWLGPAGPAAVHTLARGRHVDYRDRHRRHPVRPLSARAGLNNPADERVRHQSVHRHGLRAHSCYADLQARTFPHEAVMSQRHSRRTALKLLGTRARSAGQTKHRHHPACIPLNRHDNHNYA